jgi:hypothetical protein
MLAIVSSSGGEGGRSSAIKLSGVVIASSISNISALSSSLSRSICRQDWSVSSGWVQKIESRDGGGSNLYAKSLEVVLKPGNFAIHAFSFVKWRSAESSYRRLPD